MGMLGQRVQSQHNVSGEDNASRLAWTSNLPTQAEGLDSTPGADVPKLRDWPMFRNSAGKRSREHLTGGRRRECQS